MVQKLNVVAVRLMYYNPDKISRECHNALSQCPGIIQDLYAHLDTHKKEALTDPMLVTVGAELKYTTIFNILNVFANAYNIKLISSGPAAAPAAASGRAYSFRARPTARTKKANASVAASLGTGLVSNMAAGDPRGGKRIVLQPTPRRRQQYKRI
ncbi:MAG: hypothetical protein COB66_08400 [Coxiella sp. (in: Bacteria)]|nr:MAG: hypothetical protein COB66_08400 [Coxiella sp. (in: g-proteobacteria)]